ncbi:MAG TPA: VOC family protein [Acidimicrobiales bacterium]|nr:VOC family protein [Acidimicrobiales bacterium]
MITSIDLDHVAVAVERHVDAWPRYVGDLGGRWLSGGDSIGFAAAQVSYANGMKLEALQPASVDRNDFLRRFLDASGPGVHHLTFKVADISAALAAAEGAGIQPVGVDLRDADWKEAFLHPKAARGVVVQLAQSMGSWSSPPPPDLPEAARGPAALAHVTHAVADLDDGLVLFADLLGGERTEEGHGPDGRWVELAWPGPGRVRLLEPVDELRRWLGGRPGRVHHLAFELDDPGAVTGARALGEDSWEVAPEDNLGVRLRLTATG